MTQLLKSPWGMTQERCISASSPAIAMASRTLRNGACVCVCVRVRVCACVCETQNFRFWDF